MDAIKIGWLGSALDGPGGGYDKIHRLAFDEATEHGVLNRPVEFVIHPENGLPQGSAKNAIDGFKYLVDEGCIAVAGAYSSDNAMVVGPFANELQVPLVSWCGTERFWGPYCFRLGNGDCGGDPALIVGWLKKHGYDRVAVLSEVSPNGEEYFRYFRMECRRRGITVAAVETVSQTPADLAQNLDNLRAVGADALVYMGYGILAASGTLREALDKLAWDPPRIMTTAFMFYLMGFEKFEGWVGIDQLCPDNRLASGFHQRYVARYGDDPPMWPNAIPVLAFDTARVLAEAAFRAPVLTGWGMKEGFEQIRFMPSATGGPQTHIAGSPYDHQLFKGDWLLYGRIRNGKLEFEGLFEPWE
jgi:branched-chain amino acid transport system substrate-binding protein